MEIIRNLIDFILHIDKHLAYIASEYGTTTYLILFLIVFAETGLVIMPFLPGDSLLFAIGALAATGALDISTVIILLTIAAILGDTVNYFIGKYTGDKVENIRFINKDYIRKTEKFYEKHGGKTIIFARFIPIIRTFAPFVAGVGEMDYKKFIVYNIIGGIVWVVSFSLIGYWFGNLPMVKKNFTLIIFGIIFFSMLPPLVEYLRHRFKKS